LNRGGVVVCSVGGSPGEHLRVHTPSEVAIQTVASEAEALAPTAPADVVLLTPGCRVAPGWIEALREAAYANSTTATATALTQRDLESAPEPFEQAAEQVRTASLRLRPRIEQPGDACVYVRRSAIELVGDDNTDFDTQCVARGLQHVLADDVLVLDPRPAGHPANESDPPETRARAAARRSLRGLSATIDARILAGPTTGTQVHVLELIAGLARTEQINLTAIIPDAPSEQALARLQSLPRVKLLTYAEAATGDHADVVHRPFQLTNAGDLTFLESLGERLILTQQDLIAFHNPAYFLTRQAWQEYRELARSALSSADRVLFFSGHARGDALSEDLIDQAHASVVYLGVDHQEMPDDPGPPPAGAESIEAGPFLLCIGTDFLHKNRIFALRLLRALRELGIDTTLVFAGPTVAHGSSRPQEDAFLGAHPELAARVKDFGAVSEGEKEWLYSRSAVVVYPSVLEGFGLVPFEAATHGVPCLWAPGSSLSELLPDEAAGIVPWDEQDSARNARTLIEDENARQRNLSAIAQAAQGLTWETTAQRLLEVYRATADAPPRPRAAGAGPGAGTALTLTEDAARLVGPGGELPPDVYRPLLAVATHPRIARPFYALLKLGYRASHGFHQRRR
jgi:glycosyltransferase involved in cell wall biosynthesis